MLSTIADPASHFESLAKTAVLGAALVLSYVAADRFSSRAAGRLKASPRQR
jgi:hypothetical protein